MFESGDNSRFRVFSRRAALMGGAQFAAFTALVGRMYYLQVLRSEEYTMLAEENRVNVRLLAPLRGKITDRSGKILASNRQNYRVLLVPEQTPDIRDTLEKLARIIPVSDRQRRRIMRDARRSPAFLPITVFENLSWEQFAQINIHGPDLPGVQPDVGDTRHYPHGADFAHVVGYVAPVSERDMEDEDPLLKLSGFRIGKSGLEKRLDRHLRGTAGASHVEVNAYGRVIRKLATSEGQAGAEIVLTLDMAIQGFAMGRLAREAASSVVMNIHNGDVIGMASTPAYNPNHFNIGLSQENWNTLVDDPKKPLVNKSIAGQYPPGSTVKPVIALAALEAGISPSLTVPCSGKYTLGNHDFHCWKKHGHGPLNLHDAIMHSCDIYFYEIARRIGIDRIAAMSRRFGLGSAFPFEVPGGKPGLVPDRKWKQATTGIPWQKGESLIAGIGQGYMLATPLQLAVMTSRLANGGKMVLPRVVHAIRDTVQPRPEDGDMGLRPEHLNQVRQAMVSVSNNVRGTAFQARIPKAGWEIAGKTGTSQVRRISRAEREAGVIKNEELEWRYRDHSLFTGFAPVADPQYAIAVVVEHGGSGSKVAAPIARDIMMRVLSRSSKRQLVSSDAPVKKER